MASENFKFTVHRQSAVLITPAKPTPYGLKPLSDIDDQEGLRFQVPIIQLYRNMEASILDPAKVIKEAIAKALVFYYPLAGRLKECSGRKLCVECTGEGVLFIEADADVALDQIESELPHSFPCLDKLLHDAEGSDGVLGCPLLLIQVTRLTCRGFVFALRFNHTMMDAAGLVQFMETVAQMARGFEHPSVKPVWNRELLNARSPPNPTFLHPEYDGVPDIRSIIIPLDDLVHRSFFFGQDQITNLKKHIPVQLRSNTTTFEILTACLWRCRTIALGLNADDDAKVIYVVNVRKKMGLTEGYYGNAIVFSTAVARVEELVKNPLEYAVGMVKMTKTVVDEEYVKSAADLLVMRGRPLVTVVRSYIVSDVTNMGLGDVDFGWGKAVYGGPAKAGVAAMPGILSYYVPFKGGIVVPVCLPGFAMAKFVEEVKKLTTGSSKQLDDESAYPNFPAI